MKVLGLCISNTLVALSGALVCQQQSFADISMGTGTIVIGLTSVIIGEVFFNDSNSHRIYYAVIFGSILYRFIISFALTLGVPPTDLRLLSSVLLAIALAIPVLRRKLRFNITKLLKGRD
jgi:putative ABC transport system permease protein